ncbi:MAG: class I SAM-dependent methyltransferase [Thiohalocapsa sp.]
MAQGVSNLTAVAPEVGGAPPAAADAAQQHLIEVRRGARFEFGKNWSRFLHHLTAERIAAAEESLQDFLGVERLDGKSFLDIGNGSGLFSLAARRLGARVHSFDYDPHSVACARELRRRFFPEDPEWAIEQASVLDQAYMASLGQFDIVYSWGVLHHTGAMYEALANVKPLVPVGGKLFIAIYNDLGAETDEWERIKRRYNRLPRGLGLRLLYALRLIWRMEGPAARAAWHAGRLRPWIRSLRDYGRGSARGMSRWHDYIDWIGGYPYERASVQQIVDFYGRDGFRLVRLHDRSAGFGCNQYVFDRVAPAGVFIDSPIPGGNSMAWRFGRRVIGPFARSADGMWTGHLPNPPDEEPGAGLYLVRDERLVGRVARDAEGRVALPVGDDDPASLAGAALHVLAARRRLLARPFNHIRGHLWEAKAPELAGLADTAAAPRRSPAFLFEDGRQLSRAHVRHDEIAERGEGRFSHWGGSFYFAPSDSSDPNDNGREYVALVAVEKLPPERAAGRRYGLPLTGPFENTAAGWLAPPPSALAGNAELVLLRDDRLVGSPVADDRGRIRVAPPEEPEERVRQSRFDLVPGRTEPLVGPFRQHGGEMWSAAVPHLAALADNSTHPNRSPVFVFEEGYQLPYPHAGHKIIGEFGGGRFSHWGVTLYFSTMAGDDPNGRPDGYVLLVPATGDTLQ